MSKIISFNRKVPEINYPRGQLSWDSCPDPPVHFSTGLMVIVINVNKVIKYFDKYMKYN